jgi:hypothetical protein
MKNSRSSSFSRGARIVGWARAAVAIGQKLNAKVEDQRAGAPGEPMIRSQHMSDRRSAGARGPRARPELPECVCSFVSHDAEGEMLMPQDCPGFSPNLASGRRDCAATSGREVSLAWLPGVSRCSTPGYSNGIPSGCTTMEMPESRCDFSLQDADGEWVMSEDCPEIKRKG